MSEGERPIYAGLAAVSAKADARSTNYQFDIERDLCWDKSHAPGRYVPTAYLEDLGLRPPPVGTPAEELLQWGFALVLSEMFIILEEGILFFAKTEQAKITPPTRSLELLCAEEIKHIELFRRVGATLRAARPEFVAAYDEAFAPTRAILVALTRGGSEYGDAYHYMFWLLTVFFEEYTLYIDDRLQAEADTIQPLWLAANAVHRREEIQHIVTDVNHLKALTLDEASRRSYSKLFVLGVAKNLGHLTCATPLAVLVESMFPETRPALSDVPVIKRKIFQDMLHVHAFRRTREFAPHFASFAKKQSA